MISPSHFSAFEESSFHQLGRTSIAKLPLLQIRYLHKQTLKGTFGKPKNVYNEFSFSFINEKLCWASTHRGKSYAHAFFTVKIFLKLQKLWFDPHPLSSEFARSRKNGIFMEEAKRAR